MTRFNKMLLLCSVFGVVLIFQACSNKPAEAEFQGYTVRGNVPETFAGESVFLMGYGANYKRDTLASARIDSLGHFSLKDSTTEVRDVYLGMGRTGVGFILENSNFQIDWVDEDMVVEGGAVNDLVFAYNHNPEYLEYSIKAQEIIDTRFADLDRNDHEAVEQAREAYFAVADVADSIKNDMLMAIINGDANAHAKLFANIEYQDYEEPATEKQARFEALIPELGEHTVLQRELEIIQQNVERESIRATVADGQPFKDLTVLSASGDSLSLSEVVAANEYVLIDVWASWCGPCIGEMPHLKKAYADFNDKGFEIFGISVDDNEDAWLAASTEHGVTWTNTVDFDAWNAEVVKRYGINGIPDNFLIAKDGTIVASQLRGTDLEEKLKELFDV